jgi:N-acylneuraminate cytidylyltransferase
MNFPEYFNTRSQDLPNSYHDAGMFYIGTSEAWSNELKIFDEHSYPYLIPNHRVQDIDTLDDWKRAELLSKILATK